MEMVICPSCDRKHSTLRKDGNLRENIHCRCRDWSGGHTLIWWVTGIGYHVTGRNLDLIPVLVVTE